jgi:hypothetical protein
VTCRHAEGKCDEHSFTLNNIAEIDETYCNGIIHDCLRLGPGKDHHGQRGAKSGIFLEDINN